MENLWKISWNDLNLPVPHLVLVAKHGWLENVPLKPIQRPGIHSYDLQGIQSW